MRKAPRIVSPAAGQIAMLLRGVPASDQEIPFEAEVAVPTTLSWFVDGKFIGAASGDDRVWWTPSEGVHEIYVADTAGLSTRRKLEVRTRPRDPESGRDPTPPPRADRSICTPPCRSTWSPA